MPITEELVAEVDAAVQQMPIQAEADEKAKDASAAGPEANDDRPDGEADDKTVAEHEDGAEAGSPAQDNDPDGQGYKADASDEQDDKAGASDKRDPKLDAPARPAISDAALTQAVRVGLDLADARQFPTEESLLRFVAKMEAAGRKEEDKTEEEDPLAALPKLDPEQYEPEVIKTFDALKAVVARQQQAIRAFQSQSEQSARVGQESAAREVEQWFDKQVENLGADFQDALGRGAYGALDRGSPQRAKREAIATKVAVTLAGYKAAGLQAPPRDEVFAEAARLVLSDEYEKLHEKRLADDLAKRATQHINRAGGQRTKNNQSPLEEAAAAIDEKFFSRK